MNFVRRAIRFLRVPTFGDNYVLISDTTLFPDSLLTAYDGYTPGLVAGIVFFNGDTQRYGYICLLIRSVDTTNDTVDVVCGVGDEDTGNVYELLVMELSLSPSIVLGNYLLDAPALIPVAGDGGGALVIMRVVGTVTRTATSAAFTAETVVDTISVSLTEGWTYRIRNTPYVASTVADGYCRMRIREDNVTGTQLALRQQPTTGAANQSFGYVIEAEYTPTADEFKTFVITHNRQAGTGNLTSTAAADNPIYTYVDRVRYVVPP